MTSGARIASVWGSAGGPARRLSPQGRILSGLFLLSCVLVVNPVTWAGLGLWGLALASWTLATRPPWGLIGRILLLAMVLLGPWFLLGPFLHPPVEEGLVAERWISGAWSVPSVIFLRGLGSILVTVWAAAALSLSELSRGLAALPVPRILAALLLQIVHRTQALVAETQGMVQAIRVRGATTGLRSIPVLAAALPRVWMPRIIDRAERVGDAMEVRGFDTLSVSVHAEAWKGLDVIGVGLATTALAGAIAMRCVLP